MFQGYSTLGAVALRLIKDNNRYGLKQSTRYTLEQAIEVVCFRKETMLAACGAPSYVWWWFAFDEYGELYIKNDKGKLANVCTDRKRNTWRGVPDEIETDYLVEDWTPECWWCRDDRTLTKLEMAMIAMGVQPYQRCLSRYREEWSVDYMGEGDCEHHTDLLYVAPAGNIGAAWLPVPIGDIGDAPSSMRGLCLG